MLPSLERGGHRQCLSAALHVAPEARGRLDITRICRPLSRSDCWGIELNRFPSKFADQSRRRTFEGRIARHFSRGSPSILLSIILRGPMSISITPRGNDNGGAGSRAYRGKRER